MQKESDTLTVRVYDPADSVRCVRAALVSRFLNHYPARKATVACDAVLPELRRFTELLGEDTAEQLELMHSAFRVIRQYGKTCLYSVRCHRAGTSTSRPIERGIAGPGLLALVLTSSMQPPHCIASQKYTTGKVWTEPFTAVGLGGCMLPTAVSAEEALHGSVMTDGKLHADDTPSSTAAG